VNTGASQHDLFVAEMRVLGLQTKLHQWAKADRGRCFDDLFNLVCDPAFLAVAWHRVRGNQGARTAGVDGVAPRSILLGAGVPLGRLREDLKAGRFVPERVREKTIPKASGKVRHLGIPTTADRIVQAALKLVSMAIVKSPLVASESPHRGSGYEGVAVRRAPFVLASRIR
jgi:RNA-directed DNA polymerase